MKINVMDAMKEIYGNEVYTAALMMDRAAVKSIETAYQEAWDSGAGFSPATMFCNRSEDSEDEISGCARQILNSLKGIVAKAWLSQYSREEIVAICNLLVKGPRGIYTHICLVTDLEMDLGDIAREWSNLHKDEPAVYPPDPDIG